MFSPSILHSGTSVTGIGHATQLASVYHYVVLLGSTNLVSSHKVSTKDSGSMVQWCNTDRLSYPSNEVTL
jgi:hypothetical protein